MSPDGNGSAADRVGDVLQLKRDLARAALAFSAFVVCMPGLAFQQGTLAWKLVAGVRGD
jgi:hypothetical protein